METDWDFLKLSFRWVIAKWQRISNFFQYLIHTLGFKHEVIFHYYISTFLYYFQFAFYFLSSF